MRRFAERVLSGLVVGFVVVACARPAPPPAGAASPEPPASASPPAAASAQMPPPAASSAAPPAGHAHDCGSARHRFENADKWAKIFDDPSRDSWQKPDVVVKELHLAPDARVVDLGAGTGYFSVRLARAAPRGKVFAVDIEPGMLQYIERRAARGKLSNISTLLGSPTTPNVKGPVDVVLVVDTYHHIENRPAYFRGVAGGLSRHGRVVIVDFRMGKLPVGPPEKHRIPPARTQSEMQQAGYKLCGSFDGLPYQYMLEFGLDCQGH